MIIDFTLLGSQTNGIYNTESLSSGLFLAQFGGLCSGSNKLANYPKCMVPVL